MCKTARVWWFARVNQLARANRTGTKFIVCTLAANQNTFKTITKGKFTNIAIYSNGLSLGWSSSISSSKYDRDQNREKYLGGSVSESLVFLLSFFFFLRWMSSVLAIISFLFTSFKFLLFAPIININSILLCFVERHPFDSMLVKMC